MAVTVGIASGKGGVGKTTLAVLLGLTSAFYGKRTLIVDTDVGMGNVNIMLGVGYKSSLLDCLSKGENLANALVKLESKGFENLDIIPSGNLDDNVFSYSKKTVTYFLSRLTGLLQNYDIAIFDLGAGVNNFLLGVFSSVDHPILVVNPEPPSIVDAYSLMKLSHLTYGITKFNFVVNKAAKREFNKVRLKFESMRNFLPHVEMKFLGYMPPIKNLQEVVNSMRFTDAIRGNSRLREKVLEIFREIVSVSQTEKAKESFFTKLLRMLDRNASL
jgi:flagellar biosynthesis protein FlhG